MYYSTLPRSSDHSCRRRGALGGSFVLRRQPLRLVPRPPNSSLSRQLTQLPQLPPGLAAGSPSALACTGGPASAPASLHARVALLALLPAPLPAPLPTPLPPSSELGATIRGRADCDARRSLLSKSPGAASPPRASALHCMRRSHQPVSQRGCSATAASSELTRSPALSIARACVSSSANSARAVADCRSVTQSTRTCSWRLPSRPASSWPSAKPTYCCASSSATAMQPPAASLMRSTASARKQGAMSVTHGSALASSAPSCLQRSRRVRMMDTCVPPSQHACTPTSRPPCEGAASPTAAGDDASLGAAASSWLVEWASGGEGASDRLHTACARSGSPSSGSCSSNPGWPAISSKARSSAGPLGFANRATGAQWLAAAEARRPAAGATGSNANATGEELAERNASIGGRDSPPSRIARGWRGVRTASMSLEGGSCGVAVAS
eukprot:scaffold58977_cov62-Phaeocystis_antarctica.AAC.1